MHPLLFDLGEIRLPLVGPVHLALPTYGVLVATALLVGWFWVVRRARARGLDADRVSSVVFWAVLAGLVGGKLGLVAVELPHFVARPEELLSADFLRAAGVVWTAILGGLVGMVVSARRLGIAVADVVDLAAVPLPVAQAIGRLGCLAAGCCYGGVCSLPWAVTYHSPLAHARTGVPLGVPLHPAPLYEALGSLALVLPLVLFVDRRRAFPGEVGLAYLAGYSVLRFAVEFARGDAIRGLWLGGRLSTSQIVSAAVLLVVVPLWVAGRRRAGATADP
ncbi:MAG: prolipoprotein diacylglyceryl transferase [Acidobacteriota bacterium]